MNEIIFDDAIEGTAAVYTTPALNATLGSFDKWVVTVVTSNGSGSASPSITIQAETSFNERDWRTINATAEINAQTYSLVAREFFVSSENYNKLGFTRFRLQLAGTTPKAQVQLWICGRDPR
jgi:hypothetical protein